jgi:hypothetical protein
MASSDVRLRFWLISPISAIFGPISSTYGRLFGLGMKYQYLTKMNATFEPRSGSMINPDNFWTAEFEAKNNKDFN